MLDNCSQRSLIKEKIIEELGITRKKMELSLKTLTGEKSEDLSVVSVAKKDLFHKFRYQKHAVGNFCI